MPRPRAGGDEDPPAEPRSRGRGHAAT